MTKSKFNSVWDALETDTVTRELLKIRAELVSSITRSIAESGLKQREVAKVLGISQPRVSTLMKGDYESFRLDSLVKFALKLGMNIRLSCQTNEEALAELWQKLDGITESDISAAVEAARKVS